MQKPTQPKFSFLNKFLSGEANFAFWDFVSKGIGFLNTVIIISALSIYQYGIFQLLLSLYAILSNFLYLGGGVVGNDIMRFIGEGREDRAKRLFFEYHSGRIFGAVVIGLLLFFGADFLSFRYPPEAIAFVKPVALLLLFEVVFSVLKTVLNMRLHFGLVASRSTIYKIVELLVLIIFFSLGGLSVREAVISMVAGSLVSSVILVRPVLRSLSVWRKTPVSSGWILPSIFRHHGKWEVLQQFMSKASVSIQPWLIKFFVGTEAVAIYSIAQTMISSLIGFFPTKTLATLIPLKAKDPASLQKLYHMGTKYLLAFSVALAFGGAILAPLAIGLFFAKYQPSLLFFFPLLLHLPITALSSMTSTFLVVLRKQKYLFYQKVLRFLIALPMLVFIWVGGLWGLVLFQLSFSFLLFLSIYSFLRRVPPGFRIIWRDLIRFNETDKEFISRAIAAVKERIKRKFPFLFSVPRAS